MKRYLVILASFFSSIALAVSIDTNTLTKTGDISNTTGINPATAAALGLKQDAASAVTLTGTQTLTNKTISSPTINSPTGITKANVGLGNVDNTSDVNKPVSTAQQTAIAGKLDKTGGTLTGDLVGNGTANRLPNQVAGTDDAVMTRKLSDAEMWQNTPMPVGWHPTTYISGASATVSGPTCVLYMAGGVAVGSYAAVTPLGNNPLYRGGSGVMPAFGSQFSLLIDVQQNTFGSDGSAELRLLFGVDPGTTSLTDKGLAVVFQNQTTANLIAHDGTTPQTAACTITNFNIDNLCRFLITWNGTSLKLYQSAWNAGVAPRWSLKGTLNTTGLPTNMAKAAWMLALVKTVAGAQPFTTNIRSIMYAPCTIVP